MKIIPYARQSINESDIQAVVDVLKSDWLTQGPVLEHFEKMAAGYCGAKYAIAFNSATSALHTACLAAGVENGSVVWTSPNTFVASANCALYCGGSVGFVDIDPDTYNMNAAELERKLLDAKKTNTLPQVVIPVHFAGQSCAMERISSLAQEHGFLIIEDAAHAVGGSYQNHKIGCCRYSDMTVLSFHPVKIITTGEGGMVLTNRTYLYEKLLMLRSHGITRDAEHMTEEPHGPWYYQQLALGYNYRMTDIQAALGLSQLARIDEFVQRRHAIAEKYDAALRNTSCVTPRQHQENYSACHLYVIRIPKHSGKSRREVFEALRNAGIGVNVHYIPVHLQPYYRKLGFAVGDFPAAEAYYQEAISLPMYYGLTDEAQDYVIEKVRELC